ncbi:hypothetical protein ACE7GA_26705 (plasmid) [Roseomonas sp. CCTCC AB2023176]|uniref:hypothetical protein n=1 Tax=Roseomonas sp. CCTCC AB2023176 TaxID=3342640 RepID=UPI0035D9C587
MLVNNDPSGLDDDAENAAACTAWILEAEEEGWRVVDVGRDEGGTAEDLWFSSSAGLHDLPYSGAEVLTYVGERRARGRESTPIIPERPLRHA